VSVGSIQLPSNKRADGIITERSQGIHFARSTAESSVLADGIGLFNSLANFLILKFVNAGVSQ
jgi:hypothetical protein